MSTEGRLLKSEESGVPVMFGGHSERARSGAWGSQGSAQALYPGVPRG